MRMFINSLQPCAMQYLESAHAGNLIWQFGLNYSLLKSS